MTSRVLVDDIRPLNGGTVAVTGNETVSGNLTTEGVIFVPNGSVFAPSIAFINDVDTGILYDNSQLTFNTNGSRVAAIGTTANGLIVRGDSPLSWGNTATVSPDLFLYRDAANALSLKNSTNAQSFRLYNTFTDSSNYERLNVQWSANIAQIMTQAAGTGTTTRTMQIGSIGSGDVQIVTNNTARWLWTGGAGHFVASTDNTLDIGATGANRPRTVYVGTAVVLPNTGLLVQDTNASHTLSIVPGSDLTANRQFTLTTGDAARTLDISAGSVTVSSFGASLVDDTSASAARSTLGFEQLNQVIKGKTADESVTSSTTLQNDDHLFFSIGANEIWTFSIVALAGTALSTHGIRSSITVPAAATLRYGLSGDADSAVITSSGANFDLAPAAFGVTAGEIAGFVGYVFNGANAGTVQWQWAQQTSSGSALTMKKGTYMVARRLA